MTPAIAQLRRTKPHLHPRRTAASVRDEDGGPGASLAGVDTNFSAELFEWRGPAPFYWLELPEDVCDYVRAEAKQATYGWGAIPVRVSIGGTEWETSLLPRAGGYVLPVKTRVRTQECFGDGDTVAVAMSVAPRGGRAANVTYPTT